MVYRPTLKNLLIGVTAFCIGLGTVAIMSVGTSSPSPSPGVLIVEASNCQSADSRYDDSLRELVEILQELNEITHALSGAKTGQERADLSKREKLLRARLAILKLERKYEQDIDFSDGTTKLVYREVCY